MPEKITFNPDLLDSHCIIDVRSPLEFAEDHLPGAHNVPILTDAERAEIGTIHKQIGPREARVRGLELTCGRFAAMVGEITALAAGRTVLVYCWRGGLRSLSMAILLEMTGYPVQQLRGGYKAFRARVLDYFEEFVPPAPLVVIHGMTGTGKTTFINGLDRQRWTTIDLEGLACHRGSAFGAVGLDQALSQKRFDTLLWDAFRQAPLGRTIVLEGESQRIGKISLPGNLYAVMAASCKVWCSASLETRVRRLAEEYARTEYREAMAAALERIRKKLGGQRHAELAGMLEAWDVAGLARGLIEQYYDKLYYRHRPWTPDIELDLEEFGLAEERLAEFLMQEGVNKSV
ncbi:tRNA 2-selenouridine(34) synthase MnmH [Geobacter sp. SVR]|uniref:tRNA 2-selenouridine(34) synthase MnmH n=1 Tax=Geobacter sp. SVR TaxID=2495594 RepID=UPI00143EFFF9|nr:tRNA 2-selenouridine(34) synthase MnmH [Geobacter sp. SVR]BCS52263.1 tRNA 2-selenouridine synthase [Geobacter sp. SVR]GCF85076.1 tRNA 2-selenouridine synthase [Geobacter sp. SVR]